MWYLRNMVLLAKIVFKRILTACLYTSATLCWVGIPLLLLTIIARFFTEQDLSIFSMSIFPKNPVLPVTKNVPFLNVSAILISMVFLCCNTSGFNSNLNTIYLDMGHNVCICMTNCKSG